MKKYLVRWNDGKNHSAILNAFGVRRLMRADYESGWKMQVSVFHLAESDIYTPPIPMRIFYDWKFDKLSLFSMSGSLVEKTDSRMEAA